MKNDLLNALKFVSGLVEKNGTIHHRFCRVLNGKCYMNTGVVSVGIPINLDLNCTIEVSKLIDALSFSKENESFLISQTNSRTIAVNGQGSRYMIPAGDADDVQLPTPDHPVYPVTRLLTDCLISMGRLLDDKSENMHLHCIEIGNNTCQALYYDNAALLCGWHGSTFDEHSKFLVPAIFTKALRKLCAVAEPVHAGFSENSFTIWFDNGGFAKTHLYNLQYPNTQQVLSTFPPLNQLVTPPSDFVKSLETIEKFSPTKIVRFGNNTIQSTPYADSSSFFEVPFLNVHLSFDVKKLLAFKRFLTFVNFDSDKSIIFFTDNIIRGFLRGVNAAKPAPEFEADKKVVADYDDDIPF